MKVKAVFKCSEDFKSKFIHSSCLLTISVGQATHEGELFDLTMDLVNKSFASCTLLIDDSLQRHNMALNSTKDADSYYEISLKEGELWLERNKKYYNKLTIPLRIVRWDKWLNHPDFHSKVNEIKTTIEYDPSYKAVFDNSIEKFLKKYCTRLPNPDTFDLARAWRLSYDFVTEECAALCLWPELGCNFEIYPIKHNEAINATREHFVLPQHPDLLRAVNINFRNIKQIPPQSFLFQNEMHR